MFRSHNTDIADIITKKAHLVDGPEMPAVFTRFLTSVTIFNCYTSTTENTSVPREVAALPESKYPVEFQEYIEETTTHLKRRLDELHRRFQVAQS